MLGTMCPTVPVWNTTNKLGDLPCLGELMDLTILNTWRSLIVKMAEQYWVKQNNCACALLEKHCLNYFSEQFNMKYGPKFKTKMLGLQKMI